MDDIDEQDLRRAELDFCMQKSLDFVDKQALEEKKGKAAVGDTAEGDGEGEESAADREEEKPAEWLVDVRYAARLLRKANEMRVKKRLCDVTIGLADGKLEAHRSLLAAGSPFFKHLTETTRASTLNFYHVPCCVADLLFEFMYTGEVNQEKVARLSRSECRLLKEKAVLFQVADQLDWLWRQLPGLEKQQPFEQASSGAAAAAEVVAEDPNEIVKRKVLYMNERRKQGDFADWKIRISAVDIPVSKVFLAASSTYFADFFARNPMDAKSETYTLTELNRRTFRKVLNFVYTGHVITKGRELAELKDVLFQASYLGIADLSSRLVDEFESRMTIDNCFDMLAYANTVNCRQLVKTVSRYVGRMGAVAASNPGFLGLAFTDLKVALLNPELRFDIRSGEVGTASETDTLCLLGPEDFEVRVLDMLIAWLRVDRIRRSSHVTEIYHLVDRLGTPPYTGRRDELHSRLPSELNHVMSVYYTKMLQEPQPSSPQPQQPQSTDTKQALRVRRFLLPSRLLLSREFPLMRRGLERDSAALAPVKLEAEGGAEDGGNIGEGGEPCWQLAPTEWSLCSIRIYATESALTHLTGLELRYRSHGLFSTGEREERTVHYGYWTDFQRCLELDEAERITQLGLGYHRGGVCLAWVRTSADRELLGAETGESGSGGGSDEDEVVMATNVLRAPAGSGGFLHGLALRVGDAGGLQGGDGGGLTVAWAVEVDVDGLGESPWCSVVEAE